MRPHKPHLKGGLVSLSLLLLAPMCSSPPPPVPVSGEAIEAAVQNAEAELARAKGGGDE